MFQKYFADWKIHAIAFVMVIVAELISRQDFVFGPVGFALFPMLYVLVFGIVLASIKVFSMKTMVTAAPYIGISVALLVAKVGSGIGPNLRLILDAGIVLIVQEFGNAGVLLAMPAAIFIFKMGRQAVGASFSISREACLAIIGNMYGLESPEGQGVMGSYITGTLFGTLFCGILASLTLSTGLFHPFALAIASATGSASMMVAQLAPIVDAYPHLETELSALAASSQMITSLTGMYFSLFITLPIANWMYKRFNGAERHARAEAARLAKLTPKAKEKEAKRELAAAKALEEENAAKAELKKEELGIWVTRVKVLVISAVFASIGNMMFGMRTGAARVWMPWEVAPALIMIVLVVLFGLFVDEMARKKLGLKLPSIIYVSLTAVILSIPDVAIGGLEIGRYFAAETAKVGLLPLCTPILAYAGVSIGKDLEGFKKQGLGIVVVALICFVGTYLASAVIANVLLPIFGIGGYVL